MLTCPSCGRANPDVASFCMGCGGPLGATATAHDTRKTVTALFCDLVGSTTLGELHDPEVLRPLLDRYFAVMREAVERHGGRVRASAVDALERFERKEYAIGIRRANTFLAALPG